MICQLSFDDVCFMIECPLGNFVLGGVAQRHSMSNKNKLSGLSQLFYGSIQYKTIKNHTLHTSLTKWKAKQAFSRRVLSYSDAGRANIILRRSVPEIPPNFQDITH